MLLFRTSFYIITYVITSVICADDEPSTDPPPAADTSQEADNLKDAPVTFDLSKAETVRQRDVWKFLRLLKQAMPLGKSSKRFTELMDQYQRLKKAGFIKQTQDGNQTGFAFGPAGQNFSTLMTTWLKKRVPLNDSSPVGARPAWKEREPYRRPAARWYDMGNQTGEEDERPWRRRDRFFAYRGNETQDYRMPRRTHNEWYRDRATVHRERYNEWIQNRTLERIKRGPYRDRYDGTFNGTRERRPYRDRFYDREPQRPYFEDLNITHGTMRRPRWDGQRPAYRDDQTRMTRTPYRERFYRGDNVTTRYGEAEVRRPYRERYTRAYESRGNYSRGNQSRWGQSRWGESRFGDSRRGGGGGDSRWGDNRRVGGDSRWGDNRRVGGDSRWGDSRRVGGDSRWGERTAPYRDRDEGERDQKPTRWKVNRDAYRKDEKSSVEDEELARKHRDDEDVVPTGDATKPPSRLSFRERYYRRELEMTKRQEEGGRRGERGERGMGRRDRGDRKDMGREHEARKREKLRRIYALKHGFVWFPFRDAFLELAGQGKMNLSGIDLGQFETHENRKARRANLTKQYEKALKQSQRSDASMVQLRRRDGQNVSSDAEEAALPEEASGSDFGTPLPVEPAETVDEMLQPSEPVTAPTIPQVVTPAPTTTVPTTEATIATTTQIPTTTSSPTTTPLTTLAPTTQTQAPSTTITTTTQQTTTQTEFSHITTATQTTTIATTLTETTPATQVAVSQSKRGRPTTEGTNTDKPKSRRGRPTTKSDANITKPKLKRGRPKKQEKNDTADADAEPPKKRGRPPKSTTT